MRSNNFDGLRLTGALLVLVSHIHALSGRGEVVLLWDDPLSLTAGSTGVALFFAISGYLVTSSWRADPHIIRFAARRFLRMWPALAVVVIAPAVVIGHLTFRNPIDGLMMPIAAESFLQNLVPVTRYWDWDFFHHNPLHLLNGSLWTIPIEVQFYVILAALAFILRGHLRWVVLAAWPITLLYPGFPLAFLGSVFIGGAILSMFPERGRLILIAASVITLSAGSVVGAIRLLLCVAAIEIGVRSWPVLRDASRLGDLSYGTYLWAWPVQQVGIVLFGVTTLALQWAWTLPITLMLAALSWHGIEKHAMKLKPARPARHEFGKAEVGGVNVPV